MPNKILVPARKFVRLLDYVDRIGLDAETVATATGRRVDDYHRLDPELKLAGNEYSRMYREAARQMQSLKAPIPWGAGIGSEAFELMCHCIIGQRRLGDALGLAQRYYDLLYPVLGYKVGLQNTAQSLELHFSVRVPQSGSVFTPEDWDRTEHSETVALASGLLVWYSFCGWLIGRSIDMLEVHIAAPFVSDAYKEGLIKVFQCPVHFDAKANRFIANRDYLERRIVQTPDSLQGFLDNSVSQLLSIGTKPSSTTAAIRSLIRQDFNSGPPTFERVAEALHMSESSLRRRLRSENNSYQQIKDEVRCEIAIEHLRDERTSVNSLSELLGFTEPSSFVRSFRSWMGMTPKAYRDSLGGQRG